MGDPAASTSLSGQLSTFPQWLRQIPLENPTPRLGVFGGGGYFRGFVGCRDLDFTGAVADISKYLLSPSDSLGTRIRSTL